MEYFQVLADDAVYESVLIGDSAGPGSDESVFDWLWLISGQSIPAIRLTVTDRQAYRPVRTALLLIDTIRKRHRGDFAWGPSIDALTGSDRVRLAIDADRLASLLADWDRAAAQFRASQAGYLLYS